MDHISPDFLMDVLDYLYFFIFFPFPYLLTSFCHHWSKIKPVPSKMRSSRMCSLDLLSVYLLGHLCRQFLLDNSWRVYSVGFFWVSLHTLLCMLFSFESSYVSPETFLPSIHLTNFYSSFKHQTPLPQRGLLTFTLRSLLCVFLHPFLPPIGTSMMANLVTSIFPITLHHPWWQDSHFTYH